MGSLKERLESAQPKKPVLSSGTWVLTDKGWEFVKKEELPPILNQWG